MSNGLLKLSKPDHQESRVDGVLHLGDPEASSGPFPSQGVLATSNHSRIAVSTLRKKPDQAWGEVVLVLLLPLLLLLQSEAVVARLLALPATSP